MNNNRQTQRPQSISRAEYLSLENRVICILKQGWPASEITAWVAMLQGKQQALACAILRRCHPRPMLLNLPEVGGDVPNPFRAKPSRPSVPVRSTDGRPIGRKHLVEGLIPVVIDSSGTIRCASTGKTLWIALGSLADQANPGSVDQLNPAYQPSRHQVVADHRNGTN